MERGAAIATIASNAGVNFMKRMPTLLELIATPDPVAATAWCEEHADVVGDGYTFSKEAIIVWTMSTSVPLIERGIRINCTSPAPTATPMMAEFQKAVGRRFMDACPRPIGRDATPEEQAHPLIFLNSDAAAFVTGHNLVVDGGFLAGIQTGQVSMAEVMKLAPTTSA